jgi:hypothetical protein
VLEGFGYGAQGVALKRKPERSPKNTVSKPLTYVVIDETAHPGEKEYEAAKELLAKLVPAPPCTTSPPCDPKKRPVCWYCSQRKWKR